MAISRTSAQHTVHPVEPQSESIHSDVVDAPRRASKRTELLFRIVLTVCGLVAALILFEIGFRIASPLLRTTRWRDLPKTYYLPERAGPSGDFLYATPKPPNTYRIVVIGDSFTHGGTMQIFDTFPKRVERYLNLNEHQPRVEVISYAKPGASTIHEWQMFKQAVAKFEPDFILLQITLNDPEPKPYRATHRYQDKDGHIVVSGGIFEVWKSLAFLLRRLYATRSNAEYVEYFQKIFADKTNWWNFENTLEKMKTLADDQHVGFGAVIFPLFSFPFDERYPFRNLHEKLSTALAIRKIPSLDLLPAYTGIPPDRLQAIPFDNPHPSELANRIASDEIVRWFDTDKIVPHELIPKNSKEDRPELKALGLTLEGASSPNEFPEEALSSNREGVGR